MPPATFSRRSAMPASAAELFLWHSRPPAFGRLQPPWEPVEVVRVEGPFGGGQRVTVRATTLGPIGATWVAELFDVVPGVRFRDRQLSGPFAEWTHTHSMLSEGPTQSTLDDHIEYRLPIGAVGRIFGGGLVRDRLDRMFRYRHAVTASDLGRHGLYRDRPRLTVAVTGPRGLIGTDLCLFLAGGGHHVVRLSRGKAEPSKVPDGTTARGWDPDGAIDPAMLAGVDAVVHLAGENVAGGRWNAARKSRIRDSRVGPTRRLAEAAAQAGVKVFVSASAIGYYGDRGDEELPEDATPGTGFLADVCREWEAAADPARRAGVRVTHPRIGVVLSPKGGALRKQLPAFRAGGGAAVGPGTQWVSWITVGDVVGVLYHLLMTDGLLGGVNAVAPNPVRNREFGRVLAAVLRRPYLLTVPGPVLRLMFGELADAALLSSTRAVPAKLAATGFRFDHPELDGGLQFVLGR